MSPAAPAAASAPLATPPLTEAVLTLLNALVAGARPGVLELRARSLHGVGFLEQRVPIPERGAFGYLPDAVLRLLEDGGWALTLGAATRDDSARPQDLAVVFARFRLVRTFRAGELGIDPADVAAARARLAAFPVAPAVLLDGATEWVAVWPLAAPIPLDRDRARATRLQRALAERLGASTDVLTLSTPSRSGAPALVTELAADDPAGYLPVPGGIVRECGVPAPRVRVAAIAPHRYGLTDLEAALAGDGAGRTKGGRA
jgi:hypothetical protein